MVLSGASPSPPTENYTPLAVKTEQSRCGRTAPVHTVCGKPTANRRHQIHWGDTIVLGVWVFTFVDFRQDLTKRKTFSGRFEIHIEDSLLI